MRTKNIPSGFTCYFVVACAAAACSSGSSSSGGGAGAFVGTWSYTGTQSFTNCTGEASDTVTQTSRAPSPSRRTAPGLFTSGTNGCQGNYTVSGDTATAAPGSTCTVVGSDRTTNDYSIPSTSTLVLNPLSGTITGSGTQVDQVTFAEDGSTASCNSSTRATYTKG